MPIKMTLFQISGMTGMYRFLWLSGCIVGAGALAHAEDARVQAQIIRQYRGPHQDTFLSDFVRVRLLVRQAQLEVSSRLGLIQYREGFKNPLYIRFQDGIANNHENALAFVRNYATPHGINQEMIINVDRTVSTWVDFDRIFTHEMTHAVLNDAVADAASQIPHWVQEGLAQYVSGEGDERVDRDAHRIRKSRAALLVFDLDGPYNPKAYPEYFLGIQYMEDKYTVNAVQAMVRNLIAGQTIRDAIEDATGLPYETFKKNVREYALQVIKDKALPDSEILPP